MQACPDAVALVDSQGELTYTELNAAANQLADLLLERGAAAETVVAVNLPRGRDLITTLLAVLKTGAAYLPLDPTLPPERRAYFLEAAGARLVVGPHADDDNVLDITRIDLHDRPTKDRGRAIEPDHLAYVIFTSGSTGRAKAVAVTQGSLTSHAVAIANAFGMTSADRVLQFANPGFDVLGEEVFPTLLTGGAVIVAPDPTPPPIELEQFLRHARVSVVNLPSPYWDQWTRDLDAQPRRVPETLRLLVTGSDITYTQTLKTWWGHCDVPVINAYGVTESTITATLHTFVDGDLPEGNTLPIGRPIAGCEVYLLDPELEPVGDGRPGELYLGGALLARGYVGDPALTAARFIPDPYSGRPGARLYRTGDLAVWSPDSGLSFLSRVDEQIKIRGQRIEPAEIIATLLTHPAVRQAHVRAVDDEAGKKLIGYVAAEKVETADLRDHLKRFLPHAMVPAAYVILQELPLTANGKIDQNALPTPTFTISDSPPTRLTELEKQIAVIWQEVLGVERVGPDDAFFEIGGHSLLLVQVQRKLTEVLGWAVPGVALFAHPTIRELAAHLQRQISGTVGDNRAEDRAAQRRSGRARLRSRQMLHTRDAATDGH